MAMSFTDLKQRLISENREFAKLHEKHQDFEKRLDVLLGYSFLTSEEEREMAELKKQKLQLKDKMQLMIERYRTRH
jgi:uncharacterized protein YdcH (DUF465 family)